VEKLNGEKEQRRYADGVTTEIGKAGEKFYW